MFCIECAKQLCSVHIYIPKTFSERFIYIFVTFIIKTKYMRTMLCDKTLIFKGVYKGFRWTQFENGCHKWLNSLPYVHCTGSMHPLRIVFTQPYPKFEFLGPFSGFTSQLFSKLSVMHRKIKTYQMCLFWHGRIGRHRVRHMVTIWRH